MKNLFLKKRPTYIQKLYFNIFFYLNESTYGLKASHLLFHLFNEKYAIPNTYSTIEQGTSTPSKVSAAHYSLFRTEYYLSYVRVDPSARFAATQQKKKVRNESPAIQNTNIFFSDGE